MARLTELGNWQLISLQSASTTFQIELYEFHTVKYIDADEFTIDSRRIKAFSNVVLMIGFKMNRIEGG
jgi:hypothetical protein